MGSLRDSFARFWDENLINERLVGLNTHNSSRFLFVEQCKHCSENINCPFICRFCPFLRFILCTAAHVALLYQELRRAQFMTMHLSHLYFASQILFCLDLRSLGCSDTQEAMHIH